jgi:hypothetical protein
VSTEAASILSSFLGRPKEGSYLSGGQLSYNCPRCREQNAGQSDGKYNLDVTFPGGHRPPLIAACWKCGYAQPAGQLVRAYGGSRDLLDRWLAYESSVAHLLGNRRLRIARQVELPDDFEHLRGGSQQPHLAAAWDYATRVRGLSPERVDSLGLGVSQEPRWAGRVIAPSRDAQGALNFLIARAVVDLPGVPPYQTAAGVLRTDVVFNEHRIDWTQPILLVEGFFDYAAYPHNALPLLGKSMAPGSLIEQRLRQHRPPVIVGVDMDAATSRSVLAFTAGAGQPQRLKVRAAASREDILARLAVLGVQERYWLELTENDLGQVLQQVGQSGVPTVVQSAMRIDVAREI